LAAPASEAAQDLFDGLAVVFAKPNRNIMRVNARRCGLSCVSYLSKQQVLKVLRPLGDPMNIQLLGEILSVQIAKRVAPRVAAIALPQPRLPNAL